MPKFGCIAGWASILGFSVGVGALIQAWRASRAAERASQAAKEARDGVLIRTLADEFQLACNRMDDLLDLMLHDRLDEAARVAHELTSTLSEIPYRRGSEFTEARRNELLDLRTQLQTIEQQIPPPRDRPLAARKKQALIQACRESSVTLRKNLGIIKSEIESGGES